MYIVHNLKGRLFHYNLIAMSSNLNVQKGICISARMNDFTQANVFVKFLSRSSLLLALIVFVNARVWGQTTFDWLGTAPDGNWRQGLGAARWNPGGLWDEPSFGVLRFNNNHQLSMNNNVSGIYTQHQIIFGSFNTSVRTINGNTVRLTDFSGTDPKIENQSTANHIINLNIEGDGNSDPLEINPVSGNLTINGTINNQGTDIVMWGENGWSVTYNGVISGSGKFITKQRSIAIFNTSNTYSGNTEIEKGEIWIGSNGNLPNSEIWVGNGGSLSNVAKLFLQHASGGTNFSRNININNGNSNTRYIGSLNSSGTHTFSGNISRSSANQLNIEVVETNGTLEVSGIINGSGSILKEGSGTLVLSGANTYSGSTTINVGTLRLNRSGGTTIPNTNNVSVSGGTLRISSNQELNNLTVSNGATLIIDANTTLTINGTFTGGGAIQNNGNLILKGNSTFPGSSSTISSMVNLEINRSSGITLDKDITVTGTLTLTDGILTLGSSNLTLGQTATISGTPSETKMIVATSSGKLIKLFSGTGSFTFPVGDNIVTAEYSPITLNFTSGTFSSASASVSLTDAEHPNIATTDKLSRYWNVSTSGITSFVCNVSASYLQADVVGNESNLWSMKYDGAAWSYGTQVNSTNNTISFNTTSFSDFTAGNNITLPVTFTSLTGTIRNGRANLNWNIADEHNVDRYEVEESANGRQFQTFTQVDAASRSNYQATDAQLHTGANYYRVKAVDIDGKFTYSKIIRLDNNLAVDNDIRVYPNPSRGELNLGMNIPAGNYQIRLINAMGQTVYQQPLTHEGGSRSMQLGLPKLTSGVYQVEVRGGVQKHVRTVRIE